MKLASYWHLLRDNRNFRLVWMAQVVSELGDWFYSVAIFSFLLELTGSAQLVSLAFMMQVLPQFLVSPMAGVINDRVSRKKVMILADWSRAGVVVSMILVRSRGTLWLLFVLLFIETVCWALFEPARSAIVPNITDAGQIPVANALGSATWSINFAFGAGLGGLVDVAFGRETVFVLNGLSFVASALLLRRMSFVEPHLENLPPLTARALFNFSPILDGVRYVARDPKLLATIFVKGGAGLMGSNWVILPVLGERIFPVHLHGIEPSTGGHARHEHVTGVARHWSNLRGLSRRQPRGPEPFPAAVHDSGWVFMAAAGYMALGAAGSLFAAVLTLLVAHAGGSALWTASTTLLQQQTEDRFRGRVFSAEFAFTTLMLTVSSSVAGRFVDAGVSVRAVAVATGFAMLFPGAIWAFAGKAWNRTH